MGRGGGGGSVADKDEDKDTEKDVGDYKDLRKDNSVSSELLSPSSPAYRW